MDILKTFLAAGAVTVLGSSAYGATFVNIYESDGAPPPGVNDCSGDFGSDPNCVYVSQDDYYFDGAGSGASSSYDSFDYGSLDQIVKIEGPFGSDDANFSFEVLEGGDLKWTYDPLSSLFVVYAFSVKGGDNYNVWEVDMEPTGSGAVQMFSGWSSPQGSNTGDISHITFFGKELAPIPLPAAGWLLLGGLGGLAAMKRLRKS